MSALTVHAAAADSNPSAWTLVAPELMLGASPSNASSGMDPISAPHSSYFRFPENFLFGAATSSHQVEGNCTNNDWWAWEQSGRFAERSGAACDHYRRYREDFDIARELLHNAHRFSIEWSRIEPEEGRISEEAIRHYREVLEALRERGMEPVVTLHHFTLPRWLAEKGGWESPEVERLFARYVAVILDAYRDLAHWWITINEPMAYAVKAYLQGEWPPGKRDYAAATRVIRNMLRAHARAYLVIHARQADAMVSVSQHALALTPCNPKSWRDRLSARARGYLCNRMFLDALLQGSMRVPGLLWERLPAGRTLDFVGFNYYTRDFVHNTGLSLPGLLGGACSKSHRLLVGKRNGLGWEIYPEGMGKLLGSFARYRLPILITENGVATKSDADRWTYIYMHLWQVARALGENVPLVGYLYWSLLDNFEWAEGYRPRFGLVEVDYRTQERRIRPSARLMSSIIRRNRL